MPGRCDPQTEAGGTALAEGGQGRLAVKLVWHGAKAAGAPGTSDEKGAVEATPSGAIFTSQAPRASEVHGLIGSRRTALMPVLIRLIRGLRDPLAPDQPDQHRHTLRARTR